MISCLFSSHLAGIRKRKKIDYYLPEIDVWCPVID